MSSKHERYFGKFQGFYNLSSCDRVGRLVDLGLINAADKGVLLGEHPEEAIRQAEVMIENSIGCFAIPLGVATNIVIDDAPVLVPLAIEETSVVAALSGAGKYLLKNGGVITTEQEGCGILGNVYYEGADVFPAVISCIKAQGKDFLATISREMLSSMLHRGAGNIEVSYREVSCNKSQKKILAVDLVLDCADAMGANLICQVAERCRSVVAKSTGVKGNLAIVSNLSKFNITKSRLVINDPCPDFAKNIVTACDIARADIFRAVTHNKGILNGIDGVAIATGNDWRAIESSLHGYASINGYKPLTTWSYDGSVLTGEFEGPIPVAAVGGATNHAAAKVCKKILQATSSRELAAIMASVGLLQNFAALRALVTKGIVAGHMRLHISNLIAQTNADSDEATRTRELLEERLHCLGKVTVTDAIEVLHHLRNSKVNSGA